MPPFDRVVAPWEDALEKLREKLTRQIFGSNACVQVFKIPFPRNKFEGVYSKGVIPSTSTVFEFHVQAVRVFLCRCFAIAPIDKFPPDALIM